MTRTIVLCAVVACAGCVGSALESKREELPKRKHGNVPL